jgi:adenylate cyclase
LVRDLQQHGFAAVYLSPITTGTLAQAAALARLRDDFLGLYAAAILLVLAARGLRRARELRRGLLTITYPGGRRMRVAPHVSVLDASRLGRIPHASICGGRGRCSTCRVRIIWSERPLPPPAPHERAVLEGIGADPATVRLACQLFPAGDVTLAPLIPPDMAAEFVAGRAPRIPGEERFLAAMFVDLRGSMGLAESRTPFDSVFLLGRFIAAVTRAVVSSGGRPVQFLGDGVLALFGLHEDAANACGQALAAVQEVRTQLDELARLFEQEAQDTLRYGIGLHCGRTIVGEIGFSGHVSFTALGETVNVAHRLQELARDLDVVAVISEDVFATAGVEAGGLPQVEAELRGRRAKLGVRALA